MAARRLLIVMLILLGTSTLAATLVPAPSQREETTTTTTTSTRPSAPLPSGGELVRAEIDADSKRVERIDVPLGDQLALTVKRTKAAQVEIPDLGLTDDVQRLSPARFDILAADPGRYPVRLVEGGEIGVIDVSKESDGAAAKGGGGEGQGRDDDAAKG